MFCSMFQSLEQLLAKLARRSGIKLDALTSFALRALGMRTSSMVPLKFLFDNKTIIITSFESITSKLSSKPKSLNISFVCT